MKVIFRFGELFKQLICLNSFLIFMHLFSYLRKVNPPPNETATSPECVCVQIIADRMSNMAHSSNQDNQTHL